jgi:translation initiation factor 1
LAAVAAASRAFNHEDAKETKNNIPAGSHMGDEKKPFHNPFGALGHLRDSLPAEPVTAQVPDPAPPATQPPIKGIPRAVVRLERSGRGGKEVTVVEHLALTRSERDEWLAALKSSLGCGGSVEGESLMLQGDQRERLPNLLSARGVKKITVA